MQPYICLIRDHSTAKIFDELTSPAISVFKKSISDELVYQKANQKQILINKNSFSSKWIFTKNDEECNAKNRFGDYFKVSSSIATLSNNIYLINKIHSKLYYIDDFLIDSAVIAKAASPKSLKQKKERYIIFPYYYQNNVLCRYKAEEFEKKFPQTAKYLLSKKNELDARDSDKNAEWFEYGRSQALSHLNQAKLLISTLITGKVFTYLLEDDVIPFSGLYIIPKSSLSWQKAKEILESKDFFDYINRVGVNASGHSIRISSKDIENYMWGE